MSPGETHPDSDNVALFDLDGTLADFDTAMRNELIRINPPGADIAHVYGDKVPDWLEAQKTLIKSRPGFWRNLRPIPLGLKIYRLLVIKHGFVPMVLTKGPRRTMGAWTEKAEWCDEHVPEAGLTVIREGEKCEPHKDLVYGKILVDDYPPYIDRWLKWRTRGKVIMRDTPHNQGFRHPQVLRVYDLPEDGGGLGLSRPEAVQRQQQALEKWVLP